MCTYHAIGYATDHYGRQQDCRGSWERVLEGADFEPRSVREPTTHRMVVG